MWFLIAILNPFLHAIANHMDKYILSRYVKRNEGDSLGSIVIISALCTIFTLPVILAFDHHVFTITFAKALLLIVNGGLVVGALACYFYALEYEEASVVAPLFQLIPVFGIIFGYFILNELLHGRQFLAIIILVIGGVIMSIEHTDQKIKIKRRLLLLMVGSSAFYALNATIFKLVAINQGFLGSLFWNMVGMFIFGIILYLAIPSYRQSFLNIMKKNKKFSVMGLIVINEILFATGGEIALVFAVMFAPVALVVSVTAFQPFFVLGLGVLITLLWPKIAKETLSRKVLTQRIIGIIILTIGSLLLI